MSATPPDPSGAGQPPVPPNGPQQQWQPSVPPVPGGYYVPPKRKPWVARHKVLTGLGGLVLIGALATAASGGSTGTGSTEGTSRPAVPAGSSEASAPDGTPAKAPAESGVPQQSKSGNPGLNTPVRDGKFEFTVTKVTTGKKHVGTSFMRETAQGQFVLVTVKVANIGDETRSMADDNQKVFDQQGRSFDASTTAGMAVANDNPVFYEDINPGNTVTGVLVFDMPVGAVPAKIELHDSMFSGGVTLDLQ